MSSKSSKAKSYRLAGPDGESYWLTYCFAWALTLGLMYFGAMAWIDKGEYFQAFLCLMAQVLAISFAVLARRALDKEASFYYVLANLCFMLGCCYWSELSLYNAWEASNSGVHIDQGMAWFMAILEPLLIWITEEIRFARKARDESEEIHVELPSAAAPVSIPRETPQTPAPVAEARQRPALHALQGGLSASIGAAALVQPALAAIHEAEGRTNDALAPFQGEETLALEPTQSAESPLDARRRAKEMLANNVTPIEVHRKTGVPYSTCKKWAHSV